MSSISPVATHRLTAKQNGPAFITRLQSRDTAAFAGLYENYSEALYALVLRSTSDTILAQDILQNAFLKIWLNLPSYNPQKSGLFTWMMTITRNEIIDHYRVGQAKKRTVTKQVGADFDSGPEQVVSDRLAIKHVFKDLNSRQQLMLDLIYFKGYTFHETANLLNLPVGTLKTQVRTLFRKWRSTFNVLYHQ